MTREALSAMLTKQALEHIEDARASLARNNHMHSATPEQLVGVSDQQIAEVINGFRDHLIQSNGPDGPSRGDYAKWIIREAKAFAASPTLEPIEAFHALVVGFANFTVYKQCLDLGLYARDLH